MAPIFIARKTLLWIHCCRHSSVAECMCALGSFPAHSHTHEIETKLNRQRVFTGSPHQVHTLGKDRDLRCDSVIRSWSRCVSAKAVTVTDPCEVLALTSSSWERLENLSNITVSDLSYIANSFCFLSSCCFNISRVIWGQPWFLQKNESLHLWMATSKCRNYC